MQIIDKLDDMIIKPINIETDTIVNVKNLCQLALIIQKL